MTVGVALSGAEDMMLIVLELFIRRRIVLRFGFSE
jgi:hypothetical protein